MKKKKKLKSTDILQGLQQIRKDEQATDIQATTQTKSETLFGLLSAESGKIKVGMFYYNEDKTFSKRLVAGKQVSGVVVFVDESGQHGLIDLLRQKILPWSSDGLFVALPEELSGKENTRLIIEAANKKVKEQKRLSIALIMLMMASKPERPFSQAKKNRTRLRTILN